MKRLVASSFLGLAFLSSGVNAGFLSLPSEESFTGDTCLKEGTKEGDTFRSVSGNVATVKAVAATSFRCKDPSLPALATVEYGTSAFSSKAGMSLPEGYSQETLTGQQRFRGLLLIAKSPTKGTGVQVTAIKRSVIPDMEKYAARLSEEQAKKLNDVRQTGIDHLVINDMKSWRFETQGSLKDRADAKFSYLITILEGDNEIVVINAWTSAGKYDAAKEELTQIAATVTGIKGAASQDVSGSPAVAKPLDSGPAASEAVPPKRHSALSTKIEGTFVRFVTEAPLGGTHVYTFEAEDCATGEKKVAWLGYSGLLSNNRVRLGLPVPARVPNDRMTEVSTVPDKPYVFRFRWSHTSGSRNLSCDVTMAFVPQQNQMYEAVYLPVKDGCKARVDRIVWSDAGYRREPEPSVHKTKQCKSSPLW